MQRRLVLIRHAKAEQGRPDIDRALTERGRDDARAAGAWLREHDVVPDHAVVSPARRTRQTWAQAAETLGRDVPSTVDDRIYANSPTDLLAIVAATDPAVQTLALVGHNPSVQTLAVQLAGDAADEHELHDYPTATMSVFVIDGEWWNTDSAQVAAVVTCRGAAGGAPRTGR